MGKHIKEGMTEEEIKKIEDEREQKKKEWFKNRYQKNKDKYIEREYNRREKIAKALKLLEEKQGIKLQDIK